MFTFLKGNRLTSLLILGAVFVVYLQAVRNSYVDWDDFKLVVHNPILQSLSLKNIWLAFTTYDPELYIPLTLLTYHVDHIIGGGEFHAGVSIFINLLFHAGCSLGVFWIATQLTGSRWVGAVTGLVFAVHPLNTEAVVWASARKDLVSSLFFFLSWGFYLQYRDHNNHPSYKKSIVMFTLSLLAKVSTLMLPFVLLACDWLAYRPIGKKNLKEKLPYFGLSILFGIIAMVGKPGSGGLYFEKLLIGTRAVWLYIGHIFWPTKFSLLYPFTESITLNNPELLWSVIGVGIATVTFLILAKWNRWYAWAWVTFGMLLAPSFQNFTKGSNYYLDVYIGSDRYAYLAAVSIIIVTVLLFEQVLKNQKIRTALAVAIICILGYLGYKQSRMWQDTGTLFVNVLQYYPNSHLAQTNVGIILDKKGHTNIAVERFKESLRIRPNEHAYFNLGQYERAMGNLVEAKRLYLEALKINPVHALSKINLAPILLGEGKPEEALKILDQAEYIEPDDPVLLFNKATTLEVLGRTEEAIEYYEKVLEVNPEDEEVRRNVEMLRTSP